MLLETSGCAALLDLGAVPAPEEGNVEPLRWLQAFPSYGYLLATKPARAAEVRARFHDHGIDAAVVAELRPGYVLDITYEGRVERYWDLERMPLTGFSSEREGMADA
jgi:selenophosphate synthetase-related protein